MMNSLLSTHLLSTAIPPVFKQGESLNGGLEAILALAFTGVAPNPKHMVYFDSCHKHRAPSSMFWTNYSVLSFVPLPLHLCVTWHYVCASCGEGAARRWRERGREGGPACERRGEAWSSAREEVVKAGWERISRLRTSLYRRISQG